MARHPLRYRLAYWLLALLRIFARLVPDLRAPRWLPLAGNIDGKSFSPELVIRGGVRLGRSASVPAILKIEIDGRDGRTTPSVLQPVAARLFAAHPPFTFNVSFACGRARRFRPGVYGDPRSHWFNVFCGYYELDVLKSAWDRPFGYRRGERGGWDVATDDVSRLGSADWNYFSNFMYGVPLDAIEPVDQPVATFEPPASIAIGDRRWDHARASGLRASSAFLARADDRELADTVPGLTAIWQAVFGLPYRGDEAPRSFVATDMRAEFYSCFVEDDAGYRTFIFGGTVNEWWEARGLAGEDRAALNRDFMRLQMTSIESLIRRRFAHLGFRRD